MEERLHESVGAVRGHLGGKEVDREVADLGVEISGPGRFVPTSLAEKLVGELREAREEASRLGMKRIEVTEAVHSADSRVLDTFNRFGKEEVYLGCELEAIDGRNLAACRKLEMEYSSILHLGTQFLQNLEYLNIGETKITELDTRPLKSLQELWMHKTGISLLDTSALASLQILGLYGSQVRALDTRPLAGLKELGINNTPIRYINTADMMLKGIDIKDSRICKIHIGRGWRLEKLWIRGNGIAYIDVRARWQVEEVWKDDSQAVLRDEWVEACGEKYYSGAKAYRA